jgi:galactokinase
VRWPWRRECQPSEDAQHAVEHAERALTDAQALGRYADDLTRRGDEMRERWQQTRDTNHVAEQAVKAIMRRARLP